MMKLLLVSLCACTVLSQNLRGLSNHSRHDHSHLHHFKVHWDCNRPWPSLTLMMPVKSHGNNRTPKYYDIEELFFRTLLLFWPLQVSNTSLVILFDKETEDGNYIREAKATVKSLLESRMPGGVKLIGTEPSSYYSGGYNRQQYNMFWGDNFTNSEFIGFVDSDCAFITYVDREDLFENGKPVVNGRSGFNNPLSISSGWMKGDAKALGILEPFKCMSYFPVIVYTHHLKEIRDYFEQKYNMSFNDVFHQHIEIRPYSQFGIMCTYLWTYHRDDYTWYVHSETPNWDGINPPPVEGQDANLTQFTEQMKQPKPRIATHASYRNSKEHYMTPIGGWKNAVGYREFLQQGYCYSPPFPHNESFCASINPHKYHHEMHNFDYVSYEIVTPKDHLDHQAELRHHRIKHCHKDWTKDDLSFIK